MYKSVVVIALTHLRRNRVQVELAETYEVSQQTISRAVAAITPLLVQVLHDDVPTADDPSARAQYIVDGTLLPSWSWREHPELCSGKHHTTGLNVQVACTLGGHLAWISDPIDGRRHDTHRLRDSGVLDTLDPGDWIGDKGYVGNDMITPIRKPADLLDWEKEFNTAVNKIRYMDRADHRKLQNLAHHAHRLQATTDHVQRNHLSRDRSTLLRKRLNNPPTICLRTEDNFHREAVSEDARLDSC